MRVVEPALDQAQIGAQDGAPIGPESGRPVSPWLALLAAVLIIAASALSAVGMLSLMRIALPVSVMGDGTLVLLVGMLTAQITMVALTVVLVRRWIGSPLPVMALARPAGGFAVYTGYFMVMLAAIVAYNAVLVLAFGHDPLTDLRSFAPMIQSPWWPLAFLAIGIGAPVSEEVLFRGFLLPVLAKTKIGFWGAALVATILWTALHAGYSAAGIVEVLLIGLMFAFMLRQTGSLRVPMVCHAVYNSALALAVKFYPAWF